MVNTVSPSSPAVKRPRPGFCSSLECSHMYAVLQDWGSLPHHVVLRIFQYLPLIDRARASSVCRRWNDVFHVPDLWRRFEFELDQSATSYFKSTHPDLIQQIIKKHAAHLQYVSFKVRKGSAKDEHPFIFHSRHFCVSGSLSHSVNFPEFFFQSVSCFSLVIVQIEIENLNCN